MFTELIARNSRRHLRGNLLYYSAMILSVIAFYIILSLDNQDVMRFLRTMESESVDRLLLIVPVFYVGTLIILTFLIFSATGIQMHSRRRELGIYRIHGMRSGKLFVMLMAEGLRGDLTVLLIGLPSAVLVSELISLIIARLVGIGIIGHRFSVSVSALLMTVLGFLIIKLIVNAALSAHTVRKEIGTLLNDPPDGVRPGIRAGRCIAVLLLSGAALGFAYHLGLDGRVWRDMTLMAAAFLLGCLGTVGLFYSLRYLIERHIRRMERHPMKRFIFRQVQEVILHRSTALALCSLMIFSALCFFAFGMSITVSRQETHTLDYTFEAPQNDIPFNLQSVRELLERRGVAESFEALFEMKLGHFQGGSTKSSPVDISDLISRLRSMPETEAREHLINNLSANDSPYLIPQSSINGLLHAIGEPPLDLKDNEIAFYMHSDFSGDEAILSDLLKDRPEITVKGETVTVISRLLNHQLVSDRAITILFAMIVPDERFERYTAGKSDFFAVNGKLREDLIRRDGLLQAIAAINPKLDGEAIAYESYLSSIGRQLFYTIAACFLFFYLALIFLIVANTLLGIHFLMGQRRASRRYHTLVRLGAGYADLCTIADKQIHLHFGLPILIALFNSIFGIHTLFAGILPPMLRSGASTRLMIALATLLLLSLVEGCYIMIVKRLCHRHISAVLFTIPKPVDD